MSSQHTPIDVGILIRRSLFFVVLILLTLGNLLVTFRGLESAHGMDQAQIAREIARGNGFVTKMIRPVDHYLAEKKAERAVELSSFKDTYHAPLGPLVTAAVFKLVDAGNADAWQMDDKQLVHPLDRIVACVATIFFLLAIGVNYLLIARMFDAKIAGVCAIIMLFCGCYWQFALSGLPQMLMLLLFSCAMYFAHRAIEMTQEGRVAIVPALVAAVFFTLLAFTHWVTVWIALGYILFAAIAFRPRALIGVGALLMLLLPGIFIIVRNFSITGTPFGSAFLTLYNGLANGSEASVMRNIDLDAQPLVLDGLIRKLLHAALVQTHDIVPLLAGIVVAPLFFLALLHPFKQKPVANLRWAVLLMWSLNALGLALFGISKEELDPNQTHLLFAPIMTAYGVAFVSILWSRLDFVAQVPMLRNVHLMVMCVLCALPMLLDLPREARIGLTLRDRGGYPHWPPYHPQKLNSRLDGLQGWVAQNEVVFSDQPWAVAWYADRISIWLPPTKEGFAKLETVAVDTHTPAVGVLISPSSHGQQPTSQTIDLYRDFAALVLNGSVARATWPPGVVIHDKSPNGREIASHYPYIRPLVGLDMVYYSDRPIKDAVAPQD
ncbi:MAG TPA: hypothetical protein VFY13_08275 [Luteolibacter sp.]|nr:hypothetical protein [Luteolibacter sp.]